MTKEERENVANQQIDDTIENYKQKGYKQTAAYANQKLSENIDKTIKKINDFEKSQGLYKSTLREMSEKVKQLNFRKAQRKKNNYDY